MTGDPLPSEVANVWDNYIVKRQFMNIAPVLEIGRASCRERVSSPV